MNIPFPRSPENKRPLGRLLEEISWEGGPCTRLRGALRGRENPLTTEVFAALDLLPRSIFLSGVIEASSGGSHHVRQGLIADCERFNITILPGSTFLKPSATAYTKAIPVQPDVLIESSEHYCFVEAKSLVGKPSFQKEQLARQFVASVRDSGKRTPALLLILPVDPPISVSGSGQKNVADAISDDLTQVIAKSEGIVPSESLLAIIQENVLWITWERIQQVANEKLAILADQGLPQTVLDSMKRLCNSMVEAIEWHRSLAG